ncbi:MAG TPA: T9SS type A sorting domain-containing protein [Bacteroidia bacterium]|nr:T9SS type A sorting domain-containing protein [Bacteroidia bacterium]
MKKQLLSSLLFIFCCTLKIQAQVTACDSIPLSYNNSIFTTAIPASFGDSMITFQITNNHPTQGFAYPLAKIVPLNPLPPGMTLTAGSAGWNVFASSWNPGNTMPVNIYYDVTLPLPQNYTVTFQLWVSNLLPLLIDSCYFNNTFTINLNPGTISIYSMQEDITYSIYPDPAQHYLHISRDLPFRNPVNISLCNVTGKKVMEENIAPGALQKTLDVGRLSPGAYFLSIKEEGKTEVVKKIIITNE